MTKTNTRAPRGRPLPRHTTRGLIRDIREARGPVTHLEEAVDAIGGLHQLLLALDEQEVLYAAGNILMVDVPSLCAALELRQLRASRSVEAA